MSYPASGNSDIRQLTRRVRGLVKQVAYAATVTPEPNKYDILEIGTLTGPITIANPTGTPTDGQTFVLRTTQDATGRVITFGNAYAFSTQVTDASVLESASGKSEATFRYHAGTGKWRAVGIASGF